MGGHISPKSPGLGFTAQLSSGISGAMTRGRLREIDGRKIFGIKNQEVGILLSPLLLLTKIAFAVK
jgi:hypothetical protein